LAQAAELTRRLPPFVTVVGLFVNADRETIAETVAAARIDLLQFHGSERADDCSDYGRSWIKAVRMKDDVDLFQVAEQYEEANALLLDAYRPGVPGGTGAVFDWERIPAELAGRIILAGGLTPENVSAAVKRVRPYAVDVSGGVEAEAGVKDAGKIDAFMRGVHRAEQ
jgi:phosphoribosylanthranilate isomerase